MDYVISASYGNDSMAMIRWAYEQGLKNVVVAYCDTGWATPGWDLKVGAGETVAKAMGFETVRLQSMGMSELVRMKNGFPGNGKQQFCTGFLKGLPFLQWLDEADPERKAVVMVGKRREESKARKDTPEFVKDSEYHGGRTLWHPLYLHTEAERDALLQRAGIEKLPHRSKECSPCVNANRADFLRLTPGEVERVNDLEVEIGRPMFRAKRFGALGIHGVMVWAKEGRDRGDFEEEEAACYGLFGCGT
jgi:3'-phosphoadenosine 5'-phosphosulfate sulfotransferase (PAPS reductase)/FAD synthetase